MPKPRAESDFEEALERGSGGADAEIERLARFARALRSLRRAAEERANRDVERILRAVSRSTR